MSTIPLTKNYQDAALAMEKRIEAPIRKEYQNDQDQSVIEIEGNYIKLDLMEMDTWGGMMRFEFINTEYKDDDDMKLRGELSMLVPELASYMSAKTTLLVYKQVKITTTTTIQKSIDGKKQEPEIHTVEEEDWINYTREFAKHLQNNAVFAQR